MPIDSATGPKLPNLSFRSLPIAPAGARWLAGAGMDGEIQRIICAVDGSRAGEQAAHQAVMLARAGSQLHVVAIDHTLHQLLRRHPDLSEERLREALDQAVAAARVAGVQVSSQILRGRFASQILLEESLRHDLLVLGSHGHSRASGIAFARTASELAHRTRRPVLVARERRNDPAFPSRILLASDGSASSRKAVRIAAGLGEACDSQIAFVHVSHLIGKRRRAELDAQLQTVQRATRGSVEVLELRGRVAGGITRAAQQLEASLVVLGHRGLLGPRALTSVGERVFHRAPCSVLLAPGDEDGLPEVSGTAD